MTDSNDDDAGGVEGERPTARPIEPAEPDEFGLVQVWWGDGKGKTTAAMGMGLRAAGHGYRVHMLQFMKGGAGTVEDVRGEYNAIERVPRFSYENAGHYGWHGFGGGEADEEDHAAEARAGLERAREVIEEGVDGDRVHMLILDEIVYAANRELIDPAAVVELIDDRPADLELVLTGGHEEPEYLLDRADLITQVRKERHPIDDGRGARKGAEY